MYNVGAICLVMQSLAGVFIDHTNEKKEIGPPHLLSEKIKFGNSLAVSPDSKMLLVAGGTGVSVWHLPSGKLLRKISDDASMGACFCKKGKQIAYGHKIFDEVNQRNRGRVAVVDADDGKSGAGLNDLLSEIEAIEYAPLTDTFVILCNDPTSRKVMKREIVIWNGMSAKRLLTKAGMYEFPGFCADQSVFFSVENSKDMLGVNDPRPEVCYFSFMEVPTGRETLRLARRSISYVARSYDGRLVATVGVGDDTAVRVLDIVKFKEIEALPRKQKGRAILAFGLSNKVIAAADADGKVRFWDLSKKQVIGELSDEKCFSARNPIISMTFTPDSQVLVVGTLDGTISFWQTMEFLKGRVK